MKVGRGVLRLRAVGLALAGGRWDEGGAVTAFMAANGRTRDVGFERVGEPTSGARDEHDAAEASEASR